MWYQFLTQHPELRGGLAKFSHDIFQFEQQWEDSPYHEQDLQLWQPEPGRADLIVAADVFNYVGALDRMIVAAHAALAPAGRFAFTVELLRDAGDFALRPSRRYAHARTYVSGLLSGAGFIGVTMEEIVLRHDRGEPVEGLVVLATKPARPLLPAVEADEAAVTELHSAPN